MKTVARFPTHEEALVAKSYLGSHNIEALLPEDAIQSTIPHLTGKQGYELMVIDEDFLPAQRALESVIDPNNLVGEQTDATVPWKAIAIVVILILLAVTIRNIL